MIEPDGMADNFRRESVTFIWRFHPSTIVDVGITSQYPRKSSRRGPRGSEAGGLSRSRPLILLIHSARFRSQQSRETGGFIPHAILQDPPADLSVPIAVITSEVNPVEATILVADGHCSLEFAVGFNTVHELVDRTSSQPQEACRERRRSYRARKCLVRYD